MVRCPLFSIVKKSIDRSHFLAIECTKLLIHVGFSLIWPICAEVPQVSRNRLDLLYLTFPSLRKIAMPSSDSPQRFLSEGARAKMIKDLAGKGSGWIYGVVMIASGFVILQFFGAKSLHLLWALLFGAIASSLWEGHQRRSLEEKDDQLLQLEHNEFQGKRVASRLLTGLGAVAVVFFVAFGYLARSRDDGAQAPRVDCAVEQVDVEPYVFVLNDEPDAGYIVMARIANKGTSTSINVSAHLSTSEGDFERATTRHFGESSSQVVRVDFPEPTANVASVQALVRCR